MVDIVALFQADTLPQRRLILLNKYSSVIVSATIETSPSQKYRTISGVNEDRLDSSRPDIVPRHLVSIIAPPHSLCIQTHGSIP